MVPKITSHKVFEMETEDGLYIKDEGGPWYPIFLKGIDQIFDNHEIETSEEENRRLEELFLKYCDENH